MALGRSPAEKPGGDAYYPKALARPMKPGTVSRLVPRKRPMPQRRRTAVPPPETHQEHIMKKLTLSALVVIVSSAVASAALAQDVAARKTSFNKCMVCHAIGPGAKNKVGPELNGLDGRKAATAPFCA